MALSEIAGGLRGGVAFLTRLPVESSERDWIRFQTFPAAFPLVGYLVGALTAVPFFLLDAHAAAFAYLLVLVTLVGIAQVGITIVIIDIGTTVGFEDNLTDSSDIYVIRSSRTFVRTTARIARSG
jgi:cobalamin synthase